MEGYCDCSCRDCFEIAIGPPGMAMCSACEEAGCQGGDESCDVEWEEEENDEADS